MELSELSLVLFVGHKDHFTINDNDNYYKSFSGCCKGGDILNYMQEIEHLDFKEAKAKLYRITNTPLEDYKPNPKKEEYTKTHNEKKRSEEHTSELQSRI